MTAHISVIGAQMKRNRAGGQGGGKRRW